MAIVGLSTGAIGAFQGWLIGYLGIPAFIVTLGGLLVWRNVAWFMTSGQTIGPLDDTFTMIGGIGGTMGETWSWIFGMVGRRAAFGFRSRARRKILARVPGQTGLGRSHHGANHDALPSSVRRDPERLRHSESPPARMFEANGEVCRKASRWLRPAVFRRCF
jgi:hypothetical protein